MRRLPSARHAINTVRDRRGLAIIVASRGRPRNVHPNKYQPNRKKSRSQTLSSPFLDLICVQLPPPSLSLSPFPYKSSCYRRVVAYADGRRGVATILFIRRRKPPASPWRLRERGAERSRQMARTKRVQRWEGGSVGQFVSHFISGLGHPSADSPPTPSPLHDIGERGFYFDPWRGLVNLRRRPSRFRGNNLGGCCSWKIGGWGKFVPIVSSVRKG